MALIQRLRLLLDRDSQQKLEQDAAAAGESAARQIGRRISQATIEATRGLVNTIRSTFRSMGRQSAQEFADEVKRGVQEAQRSIEARRPRAAERQVPRTPQQERALEALQERDRPRVDILAENARLQQALNQQLRQGVVRGAKEAGERAANEVLDGLRQTFNRRIIEIRDQLNRGLISRREARAAGEDAANEYNQGLARVLRESTSLRGRDFLQELNRRKIDYAVAGREAATAYTDSLRREFEVRMAGIRIRQAEGFIGPEQARLAGQRAAQEYNAALLAHIRQLRNTGQLTDARLVEISRGFQNVGQVGERAATSIRTSWGRVLSTMYLVQRTIALLGLTFSTGTIARFLFRTNLEYQQLITQLETVTGSTLLARRAFRELEHFAITTPFQLDETTRAFIRFRLFGVETSERSMRAFADFASTFGKSIEQFALAATQAAVGHTRRLQAFGIAARQQGDSITLTFEDMTFKVKRNAADIANALQQIAEAKFEGATTRAMQRLQGAVSNLRDSFAALARRIGDAGATAESTKLVRRLDDALIRLGRNSEEVDIIVGKIIRFIKDVVAVFRFLGEIFNVINETLNVLATSARTFAEEIGFGGVQAAKQLVNAFVDGVNTIIRVLNQIPAVEINLVPRLKLPDTRVVQEAFRKQRQDALNKLEEADARLRTRGREVGEALSVRPDIESDVRARVRREKEGEFVARGVTVQIGELGEQIWREINKAQNQAKLRQVRDDLTKRIADFATQGVQDLDPRVIALKAAQEEADRILAGRKPIGIIDEDDTGRGDPFDRRIRLYTKALEFARTRQQGMQGLVQLEQELAKILADGNLSFDTRIKREEQLSQVERTMFEVHAQRTSQLKELADLHLALWENQGQLIGNTESLVLAQAALKEALDGVVPSLRERLDLMQQLADIQRQLREQVDFGPLGQAADRALGRVPDLSGRGGPQSQIRRELGLEDPHEQARRILFGGQQVRFEAGQFNDIVQRSREFASDFTNAFRAGLEEVADQLRETDYELTSLNNTIADLAVGGLVGFTQAAGQAFAAFITGSKSAGQAFRQAIGSAIASVAKKKGDLYTGEALAEFAKALVPSPQSAAHLASGFKHLAAAAFMYAIAGAAEGGGRGGGGAGGADARTDTNVAQREAEQRQKFGPDIHIHVDGIDPKNPEHRRLVGDVAREYADLTGGKILWD